MKSPEFKIEHPDVTTIYNQQVTYNVNSFYILRIPRQFTMNEWFVKIMKTKAKGTKLLINRYPSTLAGFE